MATTICYLLFGLTIHFTIYIAIETFLLDISKNATVLRYYYDEISQLDIDTVRRLSLVPFLNIFILFVLVYLYTECVYRYYKSRK